MKKLFPQVNNQSRHHLFWSSPRVLYVVCSEKLEEGVSSLEWVSMRHGAADEEMFRFLLERSSSSSMRVNIAEKDGLERPA